jgi:hypothetical protein
LGFLGLNLFLSLIIGDWIRLAAYSASALFGYLFALSFRRPFFLKRKRPVSPPTKQPHLEDERFMDAMLAKISRQGEQSLSSEEKKRMQSISNRKAALKK